MTYIWIMVVSLLGSFIQGTTGFGYAIICVSLWPLFIPFKVASIVEVISAFVMTVMITFKLRSYINFGLITVPFISFMLGSTIGVSLLMKQEDIALKNILGVALILLSIYFVFYSNKVNIRATKTNSIIFGFISGICAGLFNIGGPPIVIYYLSASKNKMEYNATLQAYFTLGTIHTFFIHLLHGNVTFEVLKYSVASMITLYIGTFIGLKLFHKLPQHIIKKITYGFMAIMGVFLLL